MKGEGNEMQKKEVRGFGMRLRRRAVWGMTIWQVMLGVMLAGIAALTAVDLYQSGQEANNRNESVLLLQRLRVGIERTFSGDPSYGTSETNLVPVLARRGLIPDSALVVTAGGADDDGNALPDSTTIRHPFGGNVTVIGHVDSEPTHFKITFEDIEAEVCAALADGYVGRTRARSGIVKLDFGGTEEDAPIDRSEVTDNCTDDLNLGFVFG